MGSQVLCCAGAQIPCKKHAYLGTNKSPSPWIFPNPEGLHHKRDHEERHWLSDLVQLLVPPCSSRVLRARRLSRCDRAVGGGGGGSEHGVWDPRQNLWPFRRSRIAENTVNLPWLFSIFQLLVVGASVPLCSFNTASLSPLSQLPLVFFSSSLCPNLTTREQRQRSGYLRISVFVEIHRQGRERSSRYSRPHESRGARCYPVPKEKAFFANVLVATTLELKLGGHDPCSNFVNEQFLNFVFK